MSENASIEESFAWDKTIQKLVRKLDAGEKVALKRLVSTLSYHLENADLEDAQLVKPDSSLLADFPLTGDIGICGFGC